MGRAGHATVGGVECHEWDLDTLTPLSRYSEANLTVSYDIGAADEWCGMGMDLGSAMLVRVCDGQPE